MRMVGVIEAEPTNTGPCPSTTVKIGVQNTSMMYGVRNPVRVPPTKRFVASTDEFALKIGGFCGTAAVCGPTVWGVTPDGSLSIPRMELLYIRFWEIVAPPPTVVMWTPFLFKLSVLAFAAEPPIRAVVAGLIERLAMRIPSAPLLLITFWVKTDEGESVLIKIP